MAHKRGIVRRLQATLHRDQKLLALHIRRHYRLRAEKDKIKDTSKFRAIAYAVITARQGIGKSKSMKEAMLVNSIYGKFGSK